MLSADVASLEKIHFSTFHSSMSAVVQELYTGLPANLSTELTALSDPTVVLGAKPGTSTFVLSCSSLPSEHQRTHGLKICPQDSVEKLDCTGKVSCPELMDLLSEDPSGTGRLVENDEIQNKSIMELDYLQGCLSKDARMAKDMGDIAKEGLAQHPLTSKETCWSKEESQLIQEGRGFLSSSPCIETAGLPQSLDENQAKVQVTPENLSDPMKEAPGMKADGTRLFSKAGEPSARVSTGVPPQSSECSDVDTVMGKVAVSGTDTLVSLEPVILMDNVSTKEQLQEEEEGGGDGKGLAACVTLSAVGDALSSSDAGGEKFPNQDEEVNAILDNCPPALQDKMSLHENNSSALVLESSITVDIQASNTSSETSGLLFEGSLEFGNALWEQNTDLFEVICEMQEGGCSVTREESLKSNTSEQTEELVEEWASGQHVGETPSQTWSGEELPSDSDNEQEMDSCNDHSYSCAYERVVEIQKGAAVQRRWKAIQEKSQLENGTFAVPTEQFAVAKTMHPENNMRPLPPSPKGHPEDGFRPSYSGTDNTLIPLEEANNFGCFQNSCNVSMNSHPACHDALGADTELSDKSSVQMESNSDPRAEIPKIVSAVMHLHATNSSSTVDVSLATDEEHPQTTQLCNELLFTQQADLTLGSSLFLDTLHRERLPGTCAKLGRESFLRPNKKELASRGQNSGSWARGKKLSLSNFAQVLSEESQNWTALVLKDAENRASDMETVQSKVCTPRDDLCSAVETCSTMSGSISDDDDDDDDVDDIKVRTETTTEDSDGLEMHHTSVFDREALHPQKCGSGKVWNGHPCGNNWSGLDGAESVKAETLESDAEAESQRADGDNSSVNSEDVPNANASVFHPSVKIYGGSQRTGLSGKLTCDRGLEQTTHPLEIGILVKDQSKKEQERYQVHPCHRPSAAAATPDLSRLKNDQTSGSPGHAEQQRCSFILCSKDPGQPRETVCQNKMQSVVYQNDFNSLDLFNQKNEVPEIDVAECQQPALMLSKKQEADRSVTLSTEEMQRTVKCNQNPLPFPERGQGLTPPAPVLVIENGVQETLQRSLAGDGAFNKMVSELIDNPFKEETIELKSLKPCLRSLECAPKLLKLNGIDKGQAQQTKTDEFHSASETSSRNPSDVLDENPFLKFNSKPASTPSPAFFQQDPLTFTTSDGQTSAEGEYSKSFGNKGIPCLTCMCSAAHSVQNPGICISQKYEPPLKGLWSPLAKGHPAGAMPLEGEAGHPIHQFTLENEKASCLAGEGTHVDSPLDNEEIPVSTGGSKRGAGGVREVISVIFHSPDSSKEMKHSLEEDQSESGRTDETMGLLPVSSRSHPKNSSAALLQALKFAVAGKETAFPFYVEIHIRPSLAHLPAHTSELGLRKAKGPSKAAVVKWHSRDKQNTLQAQHSVPTRWSLETLWHTRSWASLGGSVSESFPRCLRSKRRRRVGLESKQELAGDQRPPLQGQWASCSVAAPIETEGAAAPGRRAEPSAAPAAASCAAARREDRAEEEEERRAQRRLKRRRGAAQHPAGSSSREAAGKRVDLALRSLAGGSGGGGEGCGGRSSCSTFWEPERPPEAKALTGAAAYRPLLALAPREATVPVAWHAT
ncbi:uncharacterized protein LOC134410867 [Elgaria multicarinata webbii]|uniref:uncharacterized protein LOC134410867 n=1 Tax=Elgaria multicarinata webbii TaxID=159646 RepID=UPI002FCD3556